MYGFQKIQQITDCQQVGASSGRNVFLHKFTVQPAQVLSVRIWLPVQQLPDLCRSLLLGLQAAAGDEIGVNGSRHEGEKGAAAGIVDGEAPGDPLF